MFLGAVLMRPIPLHLVYQLNGFSLERMPMHLHPFLYNLWQIVVDFPPIYRWASNFSMWRNMGKMFHLNPIYNPPHCHSRCHWCHSKPVKIPIWAPLHQASPVVLATNWAPANHPHPGPMDSARLPYFWGWTPKKNIKSGWWCPIIS